MLTYSLQIRPAGGAGGLRAGDAAASLAGGQADLPAGSGGGVPAASGGSAVEASGGRHQPRSLHLCCGGRAQGRSGRRRRRCRGRLTGARPACGRDAHTRITGWLAVGFRRLGRYRRNARSAGHARELHPTFLSDEISSPVTFGFRKPVVLLPAGFPEMDPGRQQAILCHEFLHVERSDWIVMVIEEVVRAVFWFHPAIWWVLGEIQLSREQAVDRAVVERTRAREEYVDALYLPSCGARLHPDHGAGPAVPSRRRHLKQRVVSIFKEVQMSKTRLISRLAIGLAILLTAGWLVTQTLPLAAAPQVVNDAPGVSVDIGGATLMHRAPVSYPEAARRKGVQGSVVLEATLDASGNVSDARVITGPTELRRAALDSVLQWHFANGAAGAIRQVTIGFQLPDGKAAAPESSRSISAGLAGRTVRSIRVMGLPNQPSTDELLSGLPVHIGEPAPGAFRAGSRAAVGVSAHAAQRTARGSSYADRRELYVGSVA